MYRISFMNSPEDCEWLSETHLKGFLFRPFKSFVLHGNEDSPVMVDLYEDTEPVSSQRFERIELVDLNGL